MSAVFRLCGDGRAEWPDPATGRPVRGPLGELPAALRSGATVLVPGEDVLIADVEIAARQRQRLLQAIPYAVEDQLADEVDHHHFALGPGLGANRHLVAAVALERMDGWIAALADAAIDPGRIVPDTLALPADPTLVTVLLDGARALIRLGPATALAAEADEVEDYLRLLDGGAVRLLGAGAAPAALADTPREAQDLPAFTVLARALAAGDDAPPLVDLRQGPYAPRRRAGAGSERIWRVALVLGLLALVAETTSRGLTLWADARRSAALEQEAEAVLRSRFPEIQRVVDARIQMQQALDGLRGGSGGNDSLALLRLAGPALSGDSAVRLQSLSYRQGELLLTVAADDLRHIEALRQRLVGRQLAARIESANTLADRVSARLRVGGAP